MVAKMSAKSPEQKVLYILLFVIATQGVFVVFSVLDSPQKFVEFLGFASGRYGTLEAWFAATIIAVAYVLSAMSIPDVRAHLFRASMLKWLSIAAAVVAGIVEEAIFRKWTMDFMHPHGYGPTIQVLASGVAFGIAHCVWGIQNFAAGINASLSTALLGSGLAVVYILGERSLAPCVVAHFFITALIEPGLALAAARDRLGYWRTTT